MKILIINGGENTCPGGVNKTVRETAKNLAEKHDVILLQENPLNLPKEDYYEKFKIIRVKTRFRILYGFSPEIYFYFKKHIKELNPNIIHIHGYHTLLSPEIIYLIKKISCEVPIVFSPHFDIFSHDTFAGKYLWNLYNKTVGKQIINYTSKVVVASEFEGANVNTLLNVPKNKIKVIPHGVDKIDLNKDKPMDETIHLLYVGYLLKLKGINFILETLYELIYNKKIKAFLTIIGNGPFKNELKKLAIKLNVMDFIKWKGFIHFNKSEELLQEFKKADISLLLSKSENYGIVVPESLTMGTPAIVTKRTALKEFLSEPGCFGVDYPPNPEKVADLIISIYKNNVKIGPLSNKIRVWNGLEEEYEKIYTELLGV